MAATWCVRSHASRFESRAVARRGQWVNAGPVESWAVTDFNGSYRNVLTGERVDARGEIELSELFAHLPIAVLAREGPANGQVGP